VREAWRGGAEGIGSDGAGAAAPAVPPRQHEYAEQECSEAQHFDESALQVTFTPTVTTSEGVETWLSQNQHEWEESQNQHEWEKSQQHHEVDQMRETMGIDNCE